MTTLKKSLKDILSSEALLPIDQLGDYALDGLTPETVVLPGTVEEMSQVLALASQQGKRVVPWGGGTQMALGNSPLGVDVVVSTARLDRILAYEPADLTATVEAGTTLEAFQQHLTKREQLVPLEAPQPSKATVGGILSANASGPSRLAYGTARDWLIGVKVVHADGTVTKSGGKVVKNVTGYDLNKLYVGSLGTLGVIVEATFKLAPIPPRKQALVATFTSTAAAIRAASGLLERTYPPNALQVVSGEALHRLPQGSLPQGKEAAVITFSAGRPRAVERQVDETARLMESMEAFKVESLPTSEAENLFQAITDLGWSGDTPPWLVLKINLLPSCLEELLETVLSLTSPLGSPGVVADVGFGQLQLLWWDTEAQSGENRLATDLITKIRAAASSFRGHTVVERCSSAIKANIDVWGGAADGLEIMRRIKNELDPTKILNPGRFIGGI